MVKLDDSFSTDAEGAFISVLSIVYALWDWCCRVSEMSSSFSQVGFPTAEFNLIYCNLWILLIKTKAKIHLNLEAIANQLISINTSIPKAINSNKCRRQQWGMNLQMLVCSLASNWCLCISLSQASVSLHPWLGLVLHSYVGWWLVCSLASCQCFCIALMLNKLNCLFRPLSCLETLAIYCGISSEQLQELWLIWQTVTRTS